MNASGDHHTAHLISDARTGIGAEPGDEGVDSEGLWERGTGARVGAGALRGSRRWSRGAARVGVRVLNWDRRRRRRCSRGRARVVDWGRSRSRSSAVARTRTGAGASTHGEVYARLVCLVNGGCIPVPLNRTDASLVAVITHVGHGDAEVGPLGMLAEGNRGQGVLVPADEGLADDLVGSEIDDGNIGKTVVGRTNGDGHVYHLAGGIGEDLGVIGKRNTLALPDTAIRVAALKVLYRTLDVAVHVRILSVEDLVTACLLEAIAGLSGSWADDATVSSNRRGKACNGSSDNVRLHCDGLFVVREEQ